MILRDYQSYALKKIIENDKSFLFWPRQTGKDYVISKFLEKFINDNKDSVVLYICDYLKDITWHKDKLLKIINYNLVKTSLKSEIKFINNNRLIFCSIDDDFFKISRGTNTKVVIYNDAYRARNLGLLKTFIYNIDCKCIFTSLNINTKILDVIDSNDNFYINVMTYPKHENDFDFRINKDYFNYKSKDMFDYMDKSFQRKRKLQELKKVSEF